MTQWHARVGHMAKHMNSVGGPGPGPLVPPKSVSEAKQHSRFIKVVL